MVSSPSPSRIHEALSYESRKKNPWQFWKSAGAYNNWKYKIKPVFPFCQVFFLRIRFINKQKIPKRVYSNTMYVVKDKGDLSSFQQCLQEVPILIPLDSFYPTLGNRDVFLYYTPVCFNATRKSLQSFFKPLLCLWEWVWNTVNKNTESEINDIFSLICSFFFCSVPTNR